MHQQDWDEERGKLYNNTGRKGKERTTELAITSNRGGKNWEEIT